MECIGTQRHSRLKSNWYWCSLGWAHAQDCQGVLCWEHNLYSNPYHQDTLNHVVHILFSKICIWSAVPIIVPLYAHSVIASIYRLLDKLLLRWWQYIFLSSLVNWHPQFVHMAKNCQYLEGYLLVRKCTDADVSMCVWACLRHISLLAVYECVYRCLSSCAYWYSSLWRGYSKKYNILCYMLLFFMTVQNAMQFVTVNRCPCDW